MRQRFSRWFSFVAVAFMLAAYCTTAQAALQAMGPIDPVSTLPTWYQDTTGLALVPCLDANGLCVLPPTPATPYTTVGPISNLNFPSEIFYFLADSTLPVAGGGTASLRLAFEAAFLAGVSPNAGNTFLRVNLKKMSKLPPSSTYTVTHPYGSFTFTTDGAGTALGGSGAAFRTEDLAAAPIDYFPPSLKAATNTHIGPFLKSAAGLLTDPVTGTQYLGNPAVATTVTGSPTGNNFFRITGPNIGGPGINTVQTNLFTVSGKLAPPPGTPITITAATYSQSATAGQVSVFATSTPTANLTVSGAGFPTTTMLHDPINPGNFFASIAATTPASLPGVPAEVSVVNTLDATLVPVPPPHTHPLVDGVTIAVANYDPFTHILTVKASSSDTLTPVPTLTIPALLPPTNVLDAAGLLKVTLPVPPASVTVASSGGGSATAPVTLGVLPAPVAAADTATTSASTPVTIGVLANDTPLASINPASVVITTQSLDGTAVVNANGTVTFTPATLPTPFSGVTTFAYTVADNLSQVSLPATVTVTVTPAAPALPVTVNDLATTVVGTAVTIPVLANDTITLPGVISPASVAIVTGSAVGGTPVPNPATGTVTFTPTALAGAPASFSYTVQNTLGQVSLPATVTITVTAPAPAAAAVANADVANTLVSVSRIISVLANDTGPINPASVIITTPPVLGAAVANLNGTITYASATPGTATFQYTVNNTAGVASNPALVTVSVTSAITDAVTILRAQYKTSTKQWLLEGNTTNVSPASKPVTIYVGNSLAGQILGSVVTNPSDGRWKFQLPGNAGNVPIDLTKTVSVSLPSGASRLAFPVSVSP